MAAKSNSERKPGSEAGVVGQPTAGSVLLAQRERRGLTLDQVVTAARIPAHYLKMIETDNFGLISDQLYLLPFLRRYAEFLGLEPDELAMRFIREAQRAENAPLRPLEAFPLDRGGRRRWLAALAVILAAAAAVVVYYRRVPWEIRPVMARPTPAAITPVAAASASLLPTPSPAPQAEAPILPGGGFAPPPATPAAAATP